jgi:23S rRNA (cytosine1962-C5)-methyltransferase
VEINWILPSSVTIKKGEERRLRNGHLWIFSNEISVIEGNPGNGDIIAIYDYSKNFLGIGFYNRNSLIAVRVFSREHTNDPSELIRQRIRNANDSRNRIYPGRTSYRMVYGESDLLPGLIIDKYNDTYCLQVHSAGIENFTEFIGQILTNDFSATNVFTKNQNGFRILEGLPLTDTVLLGEKSIETISDGVLQFVVDFKTTQKTGFFFDQVENRKYAASFAKEKVVLDAFCNSGGFGLHALHTGAKRVTFVDYSEREIENTRINLRANGFAEGENTELIISDAFTFFESCISAGKKYDVIVLDPPAFAKTKKTKSQGIKGYEKLHHLALQALVDGGILITSSCSYHVSLDEFLELVGKSASKAGNVLQLIYRSGASPDHPRLIAMPETDYLKFLVFRTL